MENDNWIICMRENIYFYKWVERYILKIYVYIILLYVYYKLYFINFSIYGENVYF